MGAPQNRAHEFLAVIVAAAASGAGSRGLDPEATLEHAYPLLHHLYHARVLVPPDERGVLQRQRELGVGSVVGDFRLLRSVQALDDNEVFLGRNAAGQYAAVKFYANADERTTRALEHEASMCKRIPHKCVPELYSLTRIDAGIALITEWVFGLEATNAAATLRQSATLNQQSLLALCVGIVKVFADVHESGVLHGDVHPRNVLVEGGGSVRLIDFGLAQAIEDAGGAVPRGGVAFYFDPEFAEGQLLRKYVTLSSAAEQYSLASLLYQLWTGAYYVDWSLERDTLLRQIIETMEKGDFWNLVGRAGRLSKEFSGNVFCVFGKPWESDVLGQARLTAISSAYQLNIRERAGELRSAVEAPPDSSEGGQMWAEQTFARIFAEFVGSGKLLSDAVQPANDGHVAAIDNLTRKIHAERTLPDEIYANNLYLHPTRLDGLAKYLRGFENLAAASPLFPTSDGAFDRLVEIFRAIETLMIRANNQSFKYFAFLANRWMSGATLKELVENKLTYKKISDDVDKINDAIRELFDELETALRYRYVKYTKIYVDVLRAIFLERKMPDAAAKILPLHLFLEYGASNQTIINLISLGLSRTSALLLRVVQRRMRNRFLLNSAGASRNDVDLR